MNTYGKRILALLLALVLCLSLLPAVGAEEIAIVDPEEPSPIEIVDPIEITEPEPEAELQATRKLVDSGPCGDDLTWKYFDDGELVIFGEGEMWNLRDNYDVDLMEEERQGWQQYHAQTMKITVKSGVTGIGNYAFYGFAASEVSLAGSITKIGTGAFARCGSISSLTVPSEVTAIGRGAFANCGSLTAVIFKGNLPDISSGYDSWVSSDVGAFYNITAMAVYPFGNTSYDGVTYGYGGDLTWVDSKLAEVRKPTATADPSDQMTNAHNNVQFHAHGIGLDLSYQWQCRIAPDRGWFNVSLDGAQTPTLTVKAEGDREGYQYRCKISNGNGSAYTNPATLFVKPVIDTQPTRQRVPKGETAVFRVEASGPDLQYQWQYLTPEGTTWINCASEGNQTAELQIPASFKRDQFLFRCRITSTHGKLTTKYAELRVTPGVTTQPKDVKAFVGDIAEFKVKASGADSYQWQYYSSNRYRWYAVTSSDCSGMNTDTLSVPVTVARDGLQYRCKLTNDGGTTYTMAATLHVKPTITSQPSDFSVYPGNNAKFSISAVGPDLQYRWQYLGTTTGKWYDLSDGAEAMDYKGTATKTLTVPGKASRDGMQFRCRISNSFGTINSDPASLTVLTFTDPKDASGCVGETVSFHVSAEGTDAYQWQYCSRSRWYAVTSSDCSGAQTDTLSVPVTVAREGVQYRCKLTNDGGTTYTKAATLHVMPTITKQPTNKSVSYAKDAFFTVNASGPNLLYQWQYYGASTGKWYDLSEGEGQTGIKGTATKTLTVPGKPSRDGMQFRCRIKNDYGTVYTDPVQLSVSSTMNRKPSVSYEADLADLLYVNELTNIQLFINWDESEYGGLRLQQFEWQYYDTDSGRWKKQPGNAYENEGERGCYLDLPYEAKYHGRQFRVRMTSQYGVGYSKPITLELDPVITTQPSMTTAINPGESFTLSVKASGSNLKYRWYWTYRDEPGAELMSGKTSSTLTVKNVPADGSKRAYLCVVTGANGSVISKSVSPKVKPVITMQPKSKTINVGDTAEFTIRAKTVWEGGPTDDGYTPCVWQYYDANAKKWVDASTNAAFSVFTDNDLRVSTLSVNTSELDDSISSLSIRCKVYNYDVVTISDTVKLTIKH